MLVKELIEKLSEYPEDMLVVHEIGDHTFSSNLYIEENVGEHEGGGDYGESEYLFGESPNQVKLLVIY